MLNRCIGLKDSLVYTMYRLLGENANIITKCKNWEVYVKSILQELGYVYL